MENTVEKTHGKKITGMWSTFYWVCFEATGGANFNLFKAVSFILRKASLPLRSGGENPLA
jgi:hypothetical protein